MITLDQAKSLKYGDILYHAINRNADGTPQRWKVNGQVKTWKRDLNRIQVPLKHGLYSYGYLTQDDLHIVYLNEQDAIEHNW